MTGSHWCRLVVGASIALSAVAACNEPLSSRIAVAPDVVSEARLVLSDSAPGVGATVDVSADVALPAAEVAGSYTARIRYDTTALRFEGEIAIADGTQRATNASEGVMRFAGAAQRGVVEGRLAAFRFRVLRVGAVQTLQLSVDELHSLTRGNAAASLRIAPARVKP